jgi:hypothetical protein
MKTILLLCALSVLCYSAAAQPVIEWEHVYGDTADNCAYAIAQTPDSGYVVAGSRFSPDHPVRMSGCCA